jgi:hypothetical protein
MQQIESGNKEIPDRNKSQEAVFILLSCIPYDYENNSSHYNGEQFYNDVKQQIAVKGCYV